MVFSVAFSSLGDISLSELLKLLSVFTTVPWENLSEDSISIEPLLNSDLIELLELSSSKTCSVLVIYFFFFKNLGVDFA